MKLLKTPFSSAHNHFHGVKLIHINLKLIHYTFFLHTNAA